MTPPAPVLDASFVAGALGDRLRGREGPDATFVRAIIDSRVAAPGDLFVALPGERVDGHDFAAAAVSAGASGCLLERPIDGTEPTARFLVDDSLAGLQALGARWRDALEGTEVVGVTGNVGKTTTKGMIAAVLRARYRTEATDNNYNNEIGVPLCLLELDASTERAVIEMGMYTTGEIALLCQWARPHIGVVLNVGPVHLERAGSMATIVAAKRELVEALRADGHAVLNADDADVSAMAASTPGARLALRLQRRRRYTRQRSQLQRCRGLRADDHLWRQVAASPRAAPRRPPRLERAGRDDGRARR